MSSTAISQALVDIEKNLEKLSSARKHVVDVTQSGEELTTLMVTLTRKVEKLYKTVLNESDSYNNAFIQSHNNFEQKLNTLLDKSDKSIATLQKNFQNIEPEITRKITEIADSGLEKSRILSTQHEVYFDKVTKNIDEYKISLREFSQSVTEKKLDTKFETLEKKLKWNETNIISLVKEFHSDWISERNNIITERDKNHNQVVELLKGQKLFSDKLEIHNKKLVDQFEVQKENHYALYQSIQKHNLNLKYMNYVTWTLITLMTLGIIFFK